MSSLENTKCNPKKDNKPARPCILLAILYYVLLSVISHIPGQTIQTIGIQFWDKAAHFIAYALLGVFVTIGINRLIAGRRRLYIIALAAGLVLVLGALDEIHQLFVPGRSASLLDLAADALGGLFSAILIAGVMNQPFADLNHLINSKAKIK
jgi:VanZ family protein